MKNEGSLKKKSIVRFFALVFVLLVIVFVHITLGRKSNSIFNLDLSKNETIYKCAVFDAGSTGTRIHIYNFKIQKNLEIEENTSGNIEDIKIFIPSKNLKIIPGIVYLLHQYFDGKKEEFYEYFKKIRNFLDENIEKNERSSTLIIFRASGGFRLLNLNLSNQYMEFIKSYFHKHFSEYLLIDSLLVKVLSGKEEAILSFVSTNALLKKFPYDPLIFPVKEEGKEDDTEEIIDSNEKENEKLPSERKTNNDSTAIVEIGGASAQIVVQLPLSKMNDEVLNYFNYKHKENNEHNFIKENYKKKNIVRIRLFHKDIYLYCKSYLALGRQNAMNTYLHYVVHTHTNINIGVIKKFIPIACFPKSFKFHINNLFKTSIEEDLDEYNKNKILDKNEYIGVGTGNLEQCRKEMQVLLKHSKIDDLPFKLKKFIKVYAIENFHHFVTDILNIPDKYNPLLIDTEMYLEKAKELCPLTISEIKKMINPYANTEKAQTACFGLVFLYEFLRHIFKIDHSIQIYSSNYVNNIAITWTIAVLLLEVPIYFDIIKKKKEKEVKRKLQNENTLNQSEDKNNNTIEEEL